MGKFKFDYVNPNDLSSGSKVLEPGEAKFMVKDIHYTDKEGKPLVTKNHAPKVSIVLKVKDSKNQESTIFETMTPKTNWKIYELVKAVGRKELYDPSGVDFDVLKGLTGRCSISTQSTPGYNDRTVIDYYIDHPKYANEPDAPSAPVKAAEVVVNQLDDEIPF